MAGAVAEGCWLIPGQAIVRVQGADARTFLHGQFTNAIMSLDPAVARPAAWCSAQGRVLANGTVWQTGHEDFKWMIARDLVESVAHRLRLFVLRARVSVAEAQGDRVLAAFGVSNVPPALHHLKPWSMTTTEGCHWIVAPMSEPHRPAAWCVTRQAGEEAADSGAWAAARLSGGWPCIGAATTGQFLPNALDMDLNGTIDFRKGCYPGQEVIARSHYRGTVKRRLAYGVLTGAPDAQANADARDLYAAEDPDRGPIGRVIESATHAHALHVAAEITLADWPHARYALGSPAGPVVELQPQHRLGEQA